MPKNSGDGEVRVASASKWRWELVWKVVVFDILVPARSLGCQQGIVLSLHPNSGVVCFIKLCVLIQASSSEAELTESK